MADANCPSDSPLSSLAARISVPNASESVIASRISEFEVTRLTELV
jgi:hypothetical protein